MCAQKTENIYRGGYYPWFQASAVVVGVFPEDKGGTTLYICGEAQTASLAAGYSAPHSHTPKTSSCSSVPSNVHSLHAPDSSVMSLGFLIMTSSLSHSSGTHRSVVHAAGILSELPQSVWSFAFTPNTILIMNAGFISSCTVFDLGPDAY